MRKLHGVYLDEDTLNLAQTLGLPNLSEFVRDCLSYFVSGCDRELTPSEIRELSKRFAHEKRAALLSQQKLTGQTEEEKQRIEAFRAKRQAAINESVLEELHYHGQDRFQRYLDDPNGDYVRVQDQIIEAVSKASGYPVDLADIITAFKAVRA